LRASSSQTLTFTAISGDKKPRRLEDERSKTKARTSLRITSPGNRPDARVSRRISFLSRNWIPAAEGFGRTCPICSFSRKRMLSTQECLESAIANAKTTMITLGRRSDRLRGPFRKASYEAFRTARPCRSGTLSLNHSLQLTIVVRQVEAEAGALDPGENVWVQKINPIGLLPRINRTGIPVCLRGRQERVRQSCARGCQNPRDAAHRN